MDDKTLKQAEGIVNDAVERYNEILETIKTHHGDKMAIGINQVCALRGGLNTLLSIVTQTLDEPTLVEVAKFVCDKTFVDTSTVLMAHSLKPEHDTDLEKRKAETNRVVLLLTQALKIKERMNNELITTIKAADK